MNYKLDKLVGRDPLPGDEVAFERLTRLFARARKVQPADSEKVATRKSSPALVTTLRKVVE
ncbi:MAG TPA: hypothetical protein VJ698_20675 [Noviherbaspirillum sp.]|uniref:hypothetical protein n=1 Tax=Noviherbaspirillum sp. TaxID=1926288 RepID=UPI002B46A59A|nr:hypothetical protein [Noviherbaspirillum sp.]HJV87897.1 hypothetical protein [Noviherbaspirillum sp.]